MADQMGRQTPTKSFVLDYDRSLFQEAVSLYERCGNTVMEWQRKMLKDIMAVRADGLWTHTKCGYSIPRRNGKTEVIYMRELYGLTKGEQIAHTAHRATTSTSSFNKLKRLLIKAGFEEGKDFNSVRSKGNERIEMLTTDGVIQYRTRTGSGGLGEGFDLLVIDEAQEYTDDQSSALTYTVSDSRNPQTILCGTPPTAVSKGTVFLNMRKQALGGKAKNTFWAEWSIGQISNVNDQSLWPEVNPSYGVILNARKIEDEIPTLTETDFNIQRLGVWLEYSLQSAISLAAWRSCQKEILPDLTGQIYAAVKFSKDSRNTVLSIALKTKDGQIFVECLDCRETREGLTWIIDFLKSADVSGVVIDGASGSAQLVQAMKEEKLKDPHLPKVSEIIDANSQFEIGVFQRDLCHMGQPSLEQAVSNAEHRAIGTNGGFGYSSLKPEIDVTLVECTALAYWLAKTAKPKKKRRISY